MKKAILYVAAAALILAGVHFLTQAERQAGRASGQPAVPEEKPGSLQGYIIAVDPGHGGYDGGARAGVSRVWEKEINLQVALRLQAALEEQGAKVVLTRTEDTALGEKKRADLDARLQLAKAAGAQMLLSVHMNEYHSARESGPQVFYRAGAAEGRLLAGAIQEAMVEELQPSRVRKAMAGDYYMLSGNMPSVLVECGFISNPGEEKMLMNEGYQERLAQAVCRGVCAYVQLSLAEEKAEVMQAAERPGLDQNLLSSVAGLSISSS